MNKIIIESLTDYSNIEKRIFTKEYLIHSEDTEFVHRLNLSLKYAMNIFDRIVVPCARKNFEIDR